MAQFATDADILEYEPDIKNFGIQDFGSNPNLHEKTYDDIIRLLNVEWWPTARYGAYDASVVGNNTKLSPSRLNAAQLKRAAVYHVLYEYIYPRLSSFDPDRDAFREKMDYYKQKFHTEWNLLLREGINYDLDSSGTFEDSEKQTFYHNRLIR
jgi:hypothetical protein